MSKQTNKEVEKERKKGRGTREGQRERWWNRKTNKSRVRKTKEYFYKSLDSFLQSLTTI